MPSTANEYRVHYPDPGDLGTFHSPPENDQIPPTTRLPQAIPPADPTVLAKFCFYHDGCISLWLPVTGWLHTYTYASPRTLLHHHHTNNHHHVRHDHRRRIYCQQEAATPEPRVPAHVPSDALDQRRSQTRQAKEGSIFAVPIERLIANDAAQKWSLVKRNVGVQFVDELSTFLAGVCGRGWRWGVRLTVSGDRNSGIGRLLCLRYDLSALIVHPLLAANTPNHSPPPPPCTPQARLDRAPRVPPSHTTTRRSSSSTSCVAKGSPTPRSQHSAPRRPATRTTRTGTTRTTASHAST